MGSFFENQYRCNTPDKAPPPPRQNFQADFLDNGESVFFLTTGDCKKKETQSDASMERSRRDLSKAAIFVVCASKADFGEKSTPKFVPGGVLSVFGVLYGTLIISCRLYYTWYNLAVNEFGELNCFVLVVKHIYIIRSQEQLLRNCRRVSRCCCISLVYMVLLISRTKVVLDVMVVVVFILE